jgi:hypothetical protein
LKRIYLDNNILQYFVRGFPKHIPGAAEEKRLEELLKDKDYRFALSVWSFIEISHDSIDESNRYADFIERLNPEWMSERLYIVRAEIKNFLFSTILGQKPDKSDIAWNAVFSQMMVTVNGMGDKAVIGETPRQYLKLLHEKPEYLEQLRVYPKEHPKLLADLQSAYQDQKKWREISPVVFSTWLSGLLPDRDPDGKIVPPEKRAEWLQACLDAKSDLLKSCSAFSAENSIMDFRVGDAGRKPKPSDAIDLQHAVPVAGYADVFVSADGFLRGGVSYCSKKTGRMIKVCERLSEV